MGTKGAQRWITKKSTKEGLPIGAQKRGLTKRGTKRGLTVRGTKKGLSTIWGLYQEGLKRGA